MIIGIFTDSYYPDINGVSIACQTLRDALIKRGHKVYVVTSTDKKKVFIENDIIRIPGIVAKNLYDYKLSGIFSTKVFKYLKKVKLDVIHIQTEVGIGTFGRILSKMWGIPLVYTYHTMYADYTYYLTKNHKYFDKFIQLLLKKVSKIFIDSTTCITSTSSKARDHLITCGVTNYIYVVPNGINLKRIQRCSQEAVDNFKKENNLEDCKIILSLGRVAKEKSIDTIIYGFKKYLLKHQNDKQKVKLLIVGDGPDLSRLKDIVKLLEIDQYVVFYGKVSHDKVNLFYSVADVFCSASLSETQGLTYIEAMSCQTVVLSRFDYNLINVIKDGKTGFYFDDTNDFTIKLEHIFNLSDDERKVITDNANENNYRLYSIETYAEKMENVYKDALRKYW